MKGIVKRATAVVLAVTVTCGTVMGLSVTASAASLSAGAALAGESLSFLESLFMAGGMSLGLDMILKTQNDINNWDWGDVLDDPATQGQIDNTESKINEWYDNAVKDWWTNHGGQISPSPAPTSSPDISPPVTVAPINPDDLDIPEDWATLKKNATDKGILAMGAATAYCLKEAVKGWWDNLIQPLDTSDASIDALAVSVIQSSGYPYYVTAYKTESKQYRIIFYGAGSFVDDTNQRVRFYKTAATKRNTYDSTYGSFESVSEYETLASSTCLPLFDGFHYSKQFTNLPHFSNLDEGIAWSESEKNKPPKTSLWPSVDTKDDYDNNRTLPTPSYPNLAVRSIKLPSLDEIKDLWKQGTDDSDNRPTYVTNFITNHTVQATPTPEPTKKPDAQPTPTIAVVPDPGGGTDPDPEPTPSTTPAVNPDPGGGTDPQPSGSPDPDPGGGGSTDPDNPETPPPEEEASPYKTDLREIFPFCIPFDLIHLLKVFDAEAEAPVFEFPLDIEMNNPWTGEKVVDYHHTFELDMADYEPVIKILRIFQVIFFIIALMLITRQQMIKG